MNLRILLTGLCNCDPEGAKGLHNDSSAKKAKLECATCEWGCIHFMQSM